MRFLQCGISSQVSSGDASPSSSGRFCLCCLLCGFVSQSQGSIFCAIIWYCRIGDGVVGARSCWNGFTGGSGRAESADMESGVSTLTAVVDDTIVPDVASRAADALNPSSERGGVRTRARARVDSHLATRPRLTRQLLSSPPVRSRPRTRLQRHGQNSGGTFSRRL